MLKTTNHSIKQNKNVLHAHLKEKKNNNNWLHNKKTGLLYLSLLSTGKGSYGSNYQSCSACSQVADWGSPLDEGDVRLF